MMKRLSSYRWLWLGLTLAVIAGVILIGPEERSLGTQVRVVYLHGAWVWTALAAFTAAGAAGATGLLLRKESLQCWSRALGHTGLFFWITYLPLSLWAMQTSWNGLFLAEPRWRLALVFSISGLLLQTGLSLLGDLRWTALANAGFIGVLLITLIRTENVMHPASPILTAEDQLFRLYFFGLLALTLLAGGQIAGFFKRLAGCQTA